MNRVYCITLLFENDVKHNEEKEVGLNAEVF